MSIASAITSAQQRVANAYTAVSNKGGTLPLTQNLTNLPTAINSIPTGGGSGVITSLSITPTTSEQTISATGGIDGYSPITVSAVDNTIDANISAGNIKSGVSILGITGNVVELNGSTETVTPTTSAQTITPTSPSNGLTSVTVNAVDNTIDANIVAGNIKSGVTILGVTGTYSSSVSEPYRELEVDTDGKLSQSHTTTRIVDISGATGMSPFVLAYAYCANRVISGTVNLSTITKLDYEYSLYKAFYNSSITGVNLSGLKNIIGNRTLCEAFRLSPITTLNLSSLKKINAEHACDLAFDAIDITSLDLSSLQEIKGSNSAYRMFARCSDLASVNLSSLTTVTGYGACQFMFTQCTSLTSVTFSSLSDISNGSVFDNAFAGCTALTSLSFPALTSTSFGTYNNQFANMISGCSGVTIHFPSNLDPAGGSTVISSKTGYPNFGGSSTTLAFDLTATS